MGRTDRVPSAWTGQSDHLGPSYPKELELVSGEIGEISGSQHPLVWVLGLTGKEAAKITRQVRARLRRKPGHSLPGLATLFCTSLWALRVWLQ